MNINAVIGSECTIFFPPSIQITEVNAQRILFHGSDYVTAQKLSSEILKKLNSYTSIILNHIKKWDI